MTEIIATGWQYLAAAGAFIVALVFAWLSGKSKGSTEAKAKADVEKAEESTQQAQAITEKQSETIRVVKGVEQANQSLSDSAARDRMRQSKYHSDN